MKRWTVNTNKIILFSCFIEYNRMQSKQTNKFYTIEDDYSFLCRYHCTKSKKIYIDYQKNAIQFPCLLGHHKTY